MGDLQYVGRFWTSYEFWLSLQTMTSGGLKAASYENLRVHMECIGAAREAEEILVKSMFSTWMKSADRPNKALPSPFSSGLECQAHVIFLQPRWADSRDFPVVCRTIQDCVYLAHLYFHSPQISW